MHKMNWTKGLDRYLTAAPPDDGFTDYCEAVVEAFPEQFFTDNETWIIDEPEQIDKWFDKLCYQDVSPENAAVIIERTFNLYKLNK